MFHILDKDPVFRHGITNSLVRSLTMEAIFQGEDEWHNERVFAENLRVFKQAVEMLQVAWYDDGSSGIIPLVYIEDKSSKAGPELKEILSFPTQGSLRLSDALWQSYLFTQPTWSVLRGLAKAFNSVRRERAKSGPLSQAWTCVDFLLEWFKDFVRTSPVVRRKLIELVVAHYPKEDVEKQYEKHLTLLQNFVAFQSKVVFPGEEPKDAEWSETNNSLSEANSSLSEANAMGAADLLGVGAALLLFVKKYV